MKLLSVDLTLENGDVIMIGAEDIVRLYTTPNLNVPLATEYIFQDGKLELKLVKSTFHLIIKASANKPSGIITYGDPNTLPFDRLQQFQDITHVAVAFEDDLKKFHEPRIRVLWKDVHKDVNEYQISGWQGDTFFVYIDENVNTGRLMPTNDNN